MDRMTPCWKFFVIEMHHKQRLFISLSFEHRKNPVRQQSHVVKINRL